MHFDPKASLEELLRRRMAFEGGRGDRADQARALEAAAKSAALELANLGHRMGDNLGLRDVYRQLVVEIEMAKGALRRTAPTDRR